MLDQYHTASYPGAKITRISKVIADSYDIHRTMRRFLALAARSIRAYDYDTTSRYFAIVGKMYERGNAIVKHTIENAFTRTMSTLLSLAGEKRREVIALIPTNLYFLYEQLSAH